MERLSVWLHDIRMSMCRRFLASLGYELYDMIRLAESARYEIAMDIAWRKGFGTYQEWKRSQRSRENAVYAMMARHPRRIVRLPNRSPERR